MEQELRNLAVGKDYLVFKGMSLKGIVTCCHNKTAKSHWYATEFYELGEVIYRPFKTLKELMDYIRRIR